MNWGAMSAIETVGLYFSPTRYHHERPQILESSQNKLNIHIVAHDWNIYMYNGAPSSMVLTKSKLPQKYLQGKNIDKSI